MPGGRAPAGSRVLDQPLPPAVLAHRFDATRARCCSCTTSTPSRSPSTSGAQQDVAVETPREVFADDDYPRPTKSLTGLALNGYGYRWIRLRRGWVA